MYKLYVISDVNVDYIIKDKYIKNGKLLVDGEPKIGGAGFNAAIEFKKNRLMWFL